jgi:hypothetical protein
VGRDAWDKPMPKSPDADIFKAWLRGEPEAAKALDRSDTAHLFATTPLVALLTEKGGLVRPHQARPEPRSTLADWRDRARGSLVRLFERDLAVVGGIPMTRMRGPLAYYMREANSFRLARWPGTWTVNPDESLGIFLRVDRVRDMARRLRTLCPEGHGAWSEGAFEGLAFTRDDDLAVTAAEGIRKIAGHALRSGTGPGRVLSEEVGRKALDLAALATIGLEPEEVPDAFALIEAACAEHRRSPRPLPHWIDDLEAYARDVARPILEDARAVGEDADILAGMAP